MITHTDDKKNIDPNIIRADIDWGIWTGPHHTKEHYLIVDKSLWIKELIDNPENKILIIRPRGFGKSSHLRLLCYFFEDPQWHNKDISLFNIWLVDNGHYRKYRGKYSVIYLKFRAYGYDNFESAIEIILHLINNIAIHYDLQPIVSDQDDLSFKKSSLRKCIDQISKKSGKKVILLLDDIDHILNSAIYHGYYEKMVNFFLPFLEQALEDRLQLEKTVMMSTFPLHHYKKLGIRLFGMLDTQFNNHFGFSSQELNAILYKIFTPESAKILYDYIETWHNGYQIGDHHYFCPFHMSALIEHQRRFGEYHGDKKVQNNLPANPLDFLKNYSGLYRGYRGSENLDDLLGQNRFISEFKKLLSNKPIYSKISYKPIPIQSTIASAKTIANLLLMAGFLTFKKQSDSKSAASSSLIISNNMWRLRIIDFLEKENKLINKWIRLNQYKEKLSHIINRQIYLSIVCTITMGMILLTVLNNPSNIRILLLLGGILTSIYFSKLSAADQALIKEISQELYKDIPMDLSDGLTELNKKIKNYSDDHAIKNHLSQQQKIAFLSGSHERIGCRSKLRLYFFNNTLFTSDVVQEIFEFSGHKPKKR